MVGDTFVSDDFQGISSVVRHATNEGIDMPEEDAILWIKATNLLFPSISQTILQIGTESKRDGSIATIDGNQIPLSGKQNSQIWNEIIRYTSKQLVNIF
jgi:hypothetical protein